MDKRTEIRIARSELVEIGARAAEGAPGTSGVAGIRTVVLKGDPKHQP